MQTQQPTTSQPMTASEPAASVFKMKPEEALTELPYRILRARRELWETRQTLERIDLEAKDIEARIAVDVAQELGPADKDTGKAKPRFSNQDARDSETRIRLRDHAGATDLRLRREASRLRAEVIESHIEAWTNVQRNARVLMLARSPFDAVFDVGDLA